MSENFKLGNILENIKSGVGLALQIGKTVLNEQHEKAQNSITIVYDGKAPYNASGHLYDYIKALGYPVKLMDTDKYKEGGMAISYGKVIIVGHHSLAKEQLQCIGVLQYDVCGMKFGFCGNRCVLIASRSALGRGKKGREQFSEFYDNRITFHKELANEYSTPLQFGLRDETRESQYDLLWLEFVKRGLPDFLSDMQSPKTTTTQDEEDIAQRAANDLIRKVEADKDMTFSLEDIRQNIYEQNESEGMKTLRRHLGNDIVFTSVWADAKDEHELDDSDLLEGELSACTFRVGCYAIRSAQRLYKDEGELHYTERIPVEKDAAAAYMKKRKSMLAFIPTNDDVRLVHEICIKHNVLDIQAAQDWKYICLAATSMSWSESIDFIGTVKSNATIPDEQADLFILKKYTGDSFSVAHWYKFNPDGAVTEYQEHPYDPDSFETSWENLNENNQ